MIHTQLNTDPLQQYQQYPLQQYILTVSPSAVYTNSIHYSSTNSISLVSRPRPFAEGLVHTVCACVVTLRILGGGGGWIPTLLLQYVPPVFMNSAMLEL